jgi:hypothetical protein
MIDGVLLSECPTSVKEGNLDEVKLYIKQNYPEVKDFYVMILESKFPADCIDKYDRYFEHIILEDGSNSGT